jgi:hypothetical protein
MLNFEGQLCDGDAVQTNEKKFRGKHYLRH